jgi:HSP20 family protein
VKEQQSPSSSSREVSTGRETVTSAGHSGARARGSYPSLWSRAGGDLFGMSPFAFMRQISEEFDRHFGAMSPWSASAAAGGGMWSPAIESYEQGGKMTLRADLPGMDPNDVKIEVADRILTIRGERRREEHTSGEGGAHRSEVSYGRFTRSIELPEGADVSGARAQFRNGVLEVTVPVPERDSNRREIPIEGGGSASQASAVRGTGRMEK